MSERELSSQGEWTVHADALTVGTEFYEPPSGLWFRVTKLEDEDESGTLRIYAKPCDGLVGPSTWGVVRPDDEFTIRVPS